MADLFTDQTNNEAECGWCGSGDFHPPGKQQSNNNILSTDAGDVALAREMNDLSVKERERVLDDIHGVAEIQEETPEFVMKRIGAMDIAMSMIPKGKRKAFDRALFLKPSIQTDYKFKLMFLRADVYDAQKAAKRMVKYFEEKLELFGEGKLVKKITLDDLEEEDIQNLNRVGCAVLPHRDQVGRPIWFFDMPRFNFDHPESMYRCNWYQIMTTMEDETAQLKGICDVAYCPGNLLAMPKNFAKIREVMMRNGRMIEGLPARISTFHFCYDDPRVRYVVQAIGSNFGKQVRLRIRTHFGSDLEMQYSLMTFGIVCHYLFRSAKDQHKKLSLHEDHIRNRRDVEQKAEETRKKEESESGIIMFPQPHDVLVGRGRPYQEYPGNQRLGSLVEGQLDRYRSTEDRFEKTCIIIETIQNSKSRFLQKEPQGWWKFASDKAAREKTCSAFRSKMGKANRSGTKQVLVADNGFTPSSKRIRYDPNENVQLRC